MSIGAEWAAASADCPKTMTYGPCAGVHPDGRCEVPGAGACVFTLVPAAGRPYPEVPATAPATVPATAAQGPARRPLMVVDLPAAPLSSSSLRAVAAELAGRVDACLLGDHGGAREQFPPSYRARLLVGSGLPAWAGLNCRDRNRVALAGELAALFDVGVAGVHCVTGDHPALGSRPDAAPVFDLDSLGLVELAAQVRATSGAVSALSVAHAPTVPPADLRLPRVLAKAAVGADTVFVDHCGGPLAVGPAVAALRAAGFTGTVLACVPLVIDRASAEVVLSFAADSLPAGLLETVLGAPDTVAAGVEAVADLALAMTALPGVDGVNVSGGTAPGREVVTAAALAAVADRVRAAAPVAVGA